MTSNVARQEHRDFLNQYYGVSRHFYDLSRKYYLLGRDAEISDLLREHWDSLVEIGPGTGRNLRTLCQARPLAKFGGLEASDAMLDHARRQCDFASLTQGFAEDANIEGILGRKPDRILFSYCLSMVQDPIRALENCRKALAKDGQLVIVDFCDFAGMPRFLGRGLHRWLNAFHVHPVAPSVLEAEGARISFGKGRYYLRARLAPIRCA